MKNLVKTLMFFSAFTVINAEECKQTPSFAGAYVGMQMGLSNQAYRVRCGYLEEAGNTPNLTDGRAADAHNKSYSKNVFIAGLIAGYGWVLNNTLYTGVEMVISAEGRKTFTTDDSYPQGGAPTNNQSKIAYQRGIAWGLSARFGYIINEWMPFLKLGFVISHDTIKQTLDTNMQGVGQLLTTNQYKRTKTVPSFIIGAGIDYQFTNHWLTRLTYKYRMQDTVTLPEIKEMGGAVGGRTFSGTRLKNIRSHTLQLGIIYKF